MKEQPGFLYHTDKGVVVNPQLRPFPDDYLDQQIEIGEFDGDLYEWKKNNIKVKNMWLYKFKPPHWQIEDGQPCTFKMSGKKAIITSLK